MIVSGRVSNKMAPVIKRIYDQMSEPKWVIAMGICASAGGPFNNYAIIQGVDKIFPVDVYVPGCPPRPEGLLFALEKLRAEAGARKPSASIANSQAPQGARRRRTSCRWKICTASRRLNGRSMVWLVSWENPADSGERHVKSLSPRPRLRKHTRRRPSSDIPAVAALPTGETADTTRIVERFGDDIVAAGLHNGAQMVYVKPERLLEFAEFVRTDEKLHYEALTDVTAIDRSELPIGDGGSASTRSTSCAPIRASST